ncbi:SemiSWEET family sugar transporter [Flavobacterium sp. PLA-1-15]|uniref:SemiSWEET family sugar transporter n=1 Tax=Flavobacterium sp. PLA-1-15 TaxID=3380533 RepID=UPI003B791584
MDTIQIIGLLAAVLTTAANIPQTYKIIKTRSTKDISIVTYSMLMIGFVLWVVYGFSRNDYPVLIANSISALVCATILFLKLIPKKALNKINEKVTPDK